MIIYMHQRRWTPLHWALVGGAAALSLALTWWFSDAGPGARVEPRSVRSVGSGLKFEALAVPAAQGGSAGTASPDTRTGPPPMPFRYVRHWVDKDTPVAVLATGTQQFVVRVPGLVDARYEVLAADDRQAVLRYLPLGALQSVVREGALPAAAAASAAVQDPLIEIGN